MNEIGKYEIYTVDSAIKLAESTFANPPLADELNILFKTALDNPASDSISTFLLQSPSGKQIYITLEIEYRLPQINNNVSLESNPPNFNSIRFEANVGRNDIQNLRQLIKLDDLDLAFNYVKKIGNVFEVDNINISYNNIKNINNITELKSLPITNNTLKIVKKINSFTSCYNIATPPSKICKAAITSVSPASILVTATTLPVLQVVGINFSESHRVLVNGSQRQTTYQNDGFLEAQLNAEDVDNPATLQISAINLDGETNKVNVSVYAPYIPPETYIKFYVNVTPDNGGQVYPAVVYAKDASKLPLNMRVWKTVQNVVPPAGAEIYT